MPTRTNDPPAPTSTGAWSLFELRRHLVGQAGALAQRAHQLQGRGDTAKAVQLAEEARRLRRAARIMNENDPTAISSAQRVLQR